MGTINERLKNFKTAITMVIVAAASLYLTMYAFGAQTTKNQDGDIFIPASDITEKATFYTVTVDGVKIEIFAVKAPDGSIRTAFNTCQVCFDSGRGYYKQDGNVFVCQNCGNRFRTSDIEKIKGGCNPVPIMPENKTVTEKGVTIPRSFLAEAKVIFEKWKY
jgi:uncharacterized membrane protein